MRKYASTIHFITISHTLSFTGCQTGDSGEWMDDGGERKEMMEMVEIGGRTVEFKSANAWTLIEMLHYSAQDSFFCSINPATLNRFDHAKGMGQLKSGNLIAYKVPFSFFRRLKAS